MKNKALKEAFLYLGVTLFFSYFIFWGPIAFFKIETANLVAGKIGPLWAFILFILGGFVPSGVGIALTAIFEGKPGLRDLFHSSIQIKLGLKWYLLILSVVLFYGSLLILFYTMLGGKFYFAQFWIQLPTIIPLIILGPLSEEFGWRGFALKRLLKTQNANLASLIIGLGWAFWHLPLFFMLGTSQHDFNVPIIPFLISVTSSSFIYTYIYLRTKKSLYSAIFLHWVWTYVMQVISSNVTRTYLYNWLEWIPPFLIGLLFILLLRVDKDRREKPYEYG